MDLQEGDYVDLLDDTGWGVIVAIGGTNTALVRTRDGFQNVYPLHKLIKRETQESRDNLGDTDSPAFQAHLEKEYEEVSWQEEPPFLKKEPTPRPIREIDLHIEELTDDFHQMSNEGMFRFQIRRFEREMERAIREGIQHLVFIHGVGEGVLREEIRTILRERYDCKAYDAPFSKYGAGATEVILTTGD